MCHCRSCQKQYQEDYPSYLTSKWAMSTSRRYSTAAKATNFSECIDSSHNQPVQCSPKLSLDFECLNVSWSSHKYHQTIVLVWHKKPSCWQTSASDNSCSCSDDKTRRGLSSQDGKVSTCAPWTFHDRDWFASIEEPMMLPTKVSIKFLKKLITSIEFFNVFFWKNYKIQKYTLENL